MTTTAAVGDLVALADARLQREYRDRYRRLMAWARGFDWLTDEDREEVVDDALIAWHRKLCGAGGGEFEDTFCRMVLTRRAINRLRHRIYVRAHTVELAEAEDVCIDPELDCRVVEQEESGRFWAAVGQTLSEKELRILCLSADGLHRREISQQVRIGEWEVRVWLQRARRKLRRRFDLDPRLNGLA
jgi:RNA polymerase sigma factor (sigma-70 family)